MGSSNVFTGNKEGEIKKKKWEKNELKEADDKLENGEERDVRNFQNGEEEKEEDKD